MSEARQTVSKPKAATDKVRKAYRHVDYEFSMLISTAELLRSSRDLTLPNQRAILESFFFTMSDSVSLSNEPSKDGLWAKRVRVC
jgi:hypothetical protein